MFNTEEIWCKIDDATKNWYNTTNESNIISALSIGYKMVTSGEYNKHFDLNKESRISELKEELFKLNKKYDEIKRDRDTLNLEQEKFINIGVASRTKHVDILESNLVDIKDDNKHLKTELKELKNINKSLEDNFNNLRCSMSKSKTKGELTEGEVCKEIESVGFVTKKPGIHSGDLLVYSKDNPDSLICVLEIKNYGKENKQKLGPNGSEIKKMYNDIETQLKSDDPKCVPWIFLSLGCEIPKKNELRHTHHGVRCLYLSEPSIKELLAYIECCDLIIKLNNNKNNDNIIYIHQKINEIYDIFIKLSESKPDFKKMLELNKKLGRVLTTEEIKYNNLIDNSVSRAEEVYKMIRDPKEYNNDIDLLKNIDNLSYFEMRDYVKSLQYYSIDLLEKKEIIVENNVVCESIDLVNSEIVPEIEVINKKKCDNCGAMVKNIKKHQKTKKCINKNVLVN